MDLYDGWINTWYMQTYLTWSPAKTEKISGCFEQLKKKTKIKHLERSFIELKTSMRR